jgi:ABC-type transport system involved in cytochrome c biogenesis permease subunit
VLTPWLTPQLGKDLNRMTYGTLCFSIFFSFVGTVLGGLWADDSWGRFWGWDPKENGALMIVLWNALALHARWGGMVKERGLAVLAVIGNIVVSWSWFGVNALSVGLHAYGFDSKIYWLFIILTLAHTLMFLLGLVPRNAVVASRLEDHALDYVLTLLRFCLRALELAGRLPWLALFNLRVFLAMMETCSEVDSCE